MTTRLETLGRRFFEESDLREIKPKRLHTFLQRREVQRLETDEEQEAFLSPEATTEVISSDSDSDQESEDDTDLNDSYGLPRRARANAKRQNDRLSEERKAKKPRTGVG